MAVILLLGCGKVSEDAASKTPGPDSSEVVSEEPDTGSSVPDKVKPDSENAVSEESAMGAEASVTEETGIESSSSISQETDLDSGDTLPDQSDPAVSTEEGQPDSVLSDDGSASESSIEERAAGLVQKMSIEEKVAQMFVVLPEALVSGVDGVTEAGEATREAFNEFPVGGIVYLAANLQSYDQVKSMLANVQDYSEERIGLPLFLCVDEEGGKVARVAKSGILDVEPFASMAVIGSRRNVEEAYHVGTSIGQYLHELGFTVDFAPVADVWTNPENQVVKDRSFGSDPNVVSEMASAVAKGLSENGVLAAYKHFPGHGSTAADTHAGYAYTDKTLEELYQNEFIPFQAGIEQGIPFIMAAHISLPQVTGDDVPASLSPGIIAELLRGEMGYQGIIITDAMNMGAIIQQYSSGEAAVKAIQAGNDMILMPEDAKEAYRGVLQAVADGTIAKERIDESVIRIVRTKLQMGS